MLSAEDKNGRPHAAILDDPWVTTSPGTEAPPGPGPAAVRITAAECSAELRERTRLGLRYFIDETPEERGRPYDHDLVTENIIESLSNALTAHNDSRPHSPARRPLPPPETIRRNMDHHTATCRLSGRRIAAAS